MSSFPFGPHGPETRAYDPIPNPTAPSAPVPQFGDGGQLAEGTTTVSTGGSGGPFLSLALCLMMVPLVWMFWVCLYPLTAAAGFAAGWIVSTLSAPAFPEDVEGGLGLGIIAGYAVIVFVSRVEYRLAENSVYRNSRHVLRLFLFGALAIPWIQAMVFSAGGPTETRYILAILTSPRLMLAQLADPTSLTIVLATVVGLHFLLRKAEGVRDFWHRRLRWLGLK
jgi:hypothetical protein